MVKNNAPTYEIQELLSKWKHWMANEKHYSAKTIEAYMIDVSMFFDFLIKYFNAEISVSTLKDISPQTVRAWLTSLKGKNYQSSSYSRYMAALKNFLNYIKKFEGTNIQDLSSVRIKTQRKSLPKALTVTDAMCSLKATSDISKNTWIQLRDYALLILIYGCGLRISEALSVTRSNLGSNYLVIKGKGNKERSVPILEDIRLAIDNYLKSCPHKQNNNDQLFVGVQGKPLNPAVFQRQIRKIRAKIGLSDSVTPHTFRHSFATHMLINGADLRSIQELLGHKNLATTEIYTKLDAKKILSVYSKTHPRA